MSENQKSLSKSLHRVKHTDRRIVKPAISLILVLTLLLLQVSFPVANVEAQRSVATPMISAGGAYSLALNNDRSIWAWGSNLDGALGTGERNELEFETLYDIYGSPLHIYYSTKPLMVTSLEGIQAVSTGYSHSLALDLDSTVWVWGNNSNGQLGDSTYTTRHTPVKVSKLTDVKAVSAGLWHSLALKENGTVWAWGRNEYGRLGDGTNTTRHTPVQVSGLSGAAAISGGGAHSLALKEDGTVWAWGSNFFGQLGDGTMDDKLTPVQVKGLTDVVAVSAGSLHSLAVKIDGTVWAWGDNSSGQLGDDTMESRHSPVQVSDLTSVQTVSTGDYHSLALREDGTVWAWGTNSSGLLGDGTTDSRLTPVQVSGLNDVVAVSAGSSHSLALKQDGTVLAWGDNMRGQIGDGTTTSRTVPVQSQINLGRITPTMEEIKIYIERTRQEFDDPIVIQEGRTLVPMRAFFEAMGADVSWVPASRTAIGIRGGIEVRIPIDSIHPTVNQQRVTIDVPARIINGRTYIPLRFVGEALGDEVGWDGDTRTITITR